MRDMVRGGERTRGGGGRGYRRDMGLCARWQKGGRGGDGWSWEAKAKERKLSNLSLGNKEEQEELEIGGRFRMIDCLSVVSSKELLLPRASVT